MVVLLSLVLGQARASGGAEEAEVTFRLAADAYAAGRFDEALASFLASNRLAPNPAVAFNIARCYARTHRYAEAYRWFSVAAAGLDDPEVKAAIGRELDEIVPKVVVYDIVSDPPGASVYVDRIDLGVVGVTPLELALMPRTEPRTFLFARDGYRDATVSGAVVTRGERVAVEAALSPIVGTVALEAPPGTRVHLGSPDGAVVCDAPCDGRLAPGNWVLYFVRDGYRPAVRQIDVVADATQRLAVTLEPNTGSLVIGASERGATVEIDGVVVGFTPTVASAVAVGSRRVRVSRPGYEPVERIVTVEVDRQLVIDDLELIPVNEVTAVSRRAERAELAPASVTILSTEELRAFRYPTIYEALRGVRGISLTYDSIYGSAAVRGLGQANDFGNRLLVLSDGASLNDNILYQSFIRYDGRVDLGGVDRIEVVRGPGSVLYGTGAVSGVVNLVTEPRDAPNGATFAVGTADGNVARAHAAIHRTWGERGGFRAEVAGAGSQGRVVELAPPGADPLAVSGFDQFTAGTTHGRVWLGDATVQWFHTARTVDIPTGVYDTVLGNPDGTNAWTDTRTMAELRYEPALSDTVRLLTRATVDRYAYDGVLPYGPTTSVERYVGVSFGAEARVIVEPSARFRLSTGIQGNRSPYLVLDGEDRLPDGTASSYLEASQPYSIAAGYVLTDLAPVDAVHLTAGARADYWSTFGVAVSPRLALVLAPGAHDVVKLLGGRAFRAPSIYELSYNIPGVQLRPDFDGTTLLPETVWSGELEATHLFGDGWSALVAGHGSLANQLIETVPAPGQPDVVTYRNSDLPIRILGADAELSRRFRGGWTVSAFYAGLDSRYTDGEQVPNAPAHGAGTKLIVPITAPTLRIAFRTSLEAPRRIDLQRDDTTDLAVVADAVASGTVPERGFDYAVGVYNLFDMDYAQPLGDTFPFRTMPQSGRTLMVDLSLRF
ncbi:MAG: TonB-dependent receptor [Myxococcota bacterium]